MNNEKSLKLIMSAALAAAKPKVKFKKIPTRPEGKLIVIGAGKAAASMAREFENNYEFSFGPRRNFCKFTFWFSRL